VFNRGKNRKALVNKETGKKHNKNYKPLILRSDRLKIMEPANERLDAFVLKSDPPIAYLFDELNRIP
jgi:hypothetical protein